MCRAECERGKKYRKGKCFMRFVTFTFSVALFIAVLAHATAQDTVGKDTGAARTTAKDTAASSEAAKGSEDKDPGVIVDEAVKKILKILGSSEYKDTAKRKPLQEEINQILLSHSDMKAISTLSLANYRSKFSDEQFEKFNDLFRRLLFATYVSHFNKYTNEKVVVLGTKKSDEKKAAVSTKLISDSGDTPIEYYMSKQSGKWLMYDVKVEGVSLVLNYRSQFREILLNNSVEKLIQRLADKVQKNEENI